MASCFIIQLYQKVRHSVSENSGNAEITLRRQKWTGHRKSSWGLKLTFETSIRWLELKFFPAWY